MKISSNHVGPNSRLEAAKSAQRSEKSSRVFSLKTKAETVAPVRSETRTQSVESPLASTLRSIASDLKSGRISNREEAVQKTVSAMLQERFGKAMPQDKGYQKMEKSIAGVVMDDPNLSKRIDQLLSRLA